MAYTVNAPDGQVTIKVGPDERITFKNGEELPGTEQFDKLAEIYPSFFQLTGKTEEKPFLPEYTPEEIQAEAALLEEVPPAEDVIDEVPAAEPAIESNEGD